MAQLPPMSGAGPPIEPPMDEAAEDLDHLLSPEERYRVAMGLQ